MIADISRRACQFHHRRQRSRRRADRHPDVAKISFTGSTATGKKVMASAANTLKRITLEFGGNDAGIVLDDVDPKNRASDLRWRLPEQRPGLRRDQAPLCA